jgi:hypothetical protein
MGEMHACAQVVTLDRAKDMQAVEDYGCSFSMKGICVELTVVVRPRCLVRTAGAAFLSDAAMPAKLLQARPLLLTRPWFLQTGGQPNSGQLVVPGLGMGQLRHSTESDWSTPDIVVKGKSLMHRPPDTILPCYTTC